MLRTLIQVLALILTLESALFLVRSSLALSPRSIAELSTSKWGYSADAIKNYAQQRADTVVGLVLLFFGFALQLTNSLWPMRWTDFSVNRAGALIAVALGVLVLVLCFPVSKKIAVRTYAQAFKIIEQEGLTK
jgi:hypothetical protein